MRFRTTIGLLSLALLAACGGGGGGTHIPATSNSNDTQVMPSSGNAPLASSGARTWFVDVGALRRDGALQALDFFNSAIVIDVGDSVTWTDRSIHTVSFLIDDQSPFTAPLNPAGGNPGVEDGSAFTSSGVMAPGQTYTLTFTKAGTYTYYCLLHPPEMVGQVIVQPAGMPYPHPQGYYSGQGNAAANSELAAAQASVSLFPFADGGTTLAAGISPGLSAGTPSKASVWRFLDADNLIATTITIPVNTTLTWVNESNNEPHTITFPVLGEPLPPSVANNPFSPPSGLVDANNNPIYDGSTVTNSGPIGTAAGFPANSYSLRFTKAGTYTYLCLFHDDFGMKGTVIVK